MRHFIFVIFITCLAVLNPAFAEEAPPPQKTVQEKTEQEKVKPPESMPAVINPNDMPSILFSYWEHTAIKDARRSRGLVRPPTEEELTRDLKAEDLKEARIKPPPEERDIRLGGILFTSKDHWTVWLNGQRVTPDAIPKQIIDLSVHNDYIEFKWFDEWTNQVLPLRLRPHQRFNIDSRIFLPG